MFKLNAIAVLLLAAHFPASASDEHIKLVIQEFTPLTHTNPKSNAIEGVLSDKIQEIMKRAGVSTSIQSTSLARALQAAHSEQNTCMIGLRRTAERESSYTWVGPLISDDWVLYGKKDSSIKLKNFEDAKPYRIGSYKNAATGLQLQEQGYKIEFANEDDENPRLLVNNRIDYWIVSELHGRYIAQQQGYWKDISRTVHYKHIDLYMLCHPEMDKHKIDKFNRINKELDKDGTLGKLLQKYGVR
ncbi:ABC transporter substrate-binding protein [Undibacterium piscinae]|uniref:ABC transporter substrate-binding protein n=1 Tax=Undibacterium piscinae TaxID=2495591 RepID=A0A6M4A8U9_9BURK|nr:ABC transporter substrate-binding protein [Undibacterium piscinae]